MKGHTETICGLRQPYFVMNEGHNIFKVTDQGGNGHTIQHVVLPDLLELFNHLLEKW